MATLEGFVLVAQGRWKMTPFKSDPDCHYSGELLKLLDLLPWFTPTLFSMDLMSISARLFHVPFVLELAYLS